MDIRELINRRRRQILVHSIIYYRFNDNVIDDSTWGEWALELERLQNDYPDIAETCVYANAFRDFDHSTGQNLPLDDLWGQSKAIYLLNLRDRREHRFQGGETDAIFIPIPDVRGADNA